MSRERSGNLVGRAYLELLWDSLFFLLLGFQATAHGFEMDFSGRVTVSLRDIDTESGSDSQQRVSTGSLTGFGYLWRPWFARTSVKLDISHIESEQESAVMGSSRTGDDILSGEGRINLFPSSRFPTEMFADVSDSRVETSNLISVEEIDTLRRERYGVNQQYRPASGGSRYAFQYLHSETEKNDGDEEESDDFWVTGDHRFSNNTVTYRLQRRNGDILAEGKRSQEEQQTVNLRHSYFTQEGLNLESALNQSVEEELESGILSRDRQTTLSSFLTWRPKDSKFTARANVNLLRREDLVANASGLTDSALASAGFSYDFSSALRVSADAGVSHSQSENSESDRHFENLTSSYSPVAIPLGNWRYFWGANIGLGNSGETDKRDVLTASAGIRHGLNRVFSDTQGSSVSVGVNQSYTRQQDSNHSWAYTLTHLGTLSAAWNRKGSLGRVQLSVSDSRTQGVEEEDTGQQASEDHVQTLSLLASLSRATSRYTTWNIDTSVGATRVAREASDDRFAFGLLSGGYLNNRWFDVMRLRFQSRLEYSVRESIPDEEEKTDETRVVWDNRVNYTVGLLDLSARLTVTGIDGELTRSMVLSATRYF